MHTNLICFTFSFFFLMIKVVFCLLHLNLFISYQLDIFKLFTCHILLRLKETTHMRKSKIP